MNNLEHIAKKLGRSAKELRHQNPDVALVAIQKLLDEFGTALEDSTGQAKTRPVIDFEDITKLGMTLQELEVEIGTTLEQLPNLLRRITQLNEMESTTIIADQLCSLASQIEDSPETLGRQFDELVTTMKQDFDALVSSDKAHQQERIYQEARASATSAIAESLRARGIAPLSSLETETAKNKKSEHK